MLLKLSLEQHASLSPDLVLLSHWSNQNFSSSKIQIFMRPNKLRRKEDMFSLNFSLTKGTWFLYGQFKNVSYEQKYNDYQEK